MVAALKSVLTVAWWQLLVVIELIVLGQDGGHHWLGEGSGGELSLHSDDYSLSTDARARVGNRGCGNSRTNHLLMKIFKMAAKSSLFEGLE